MLCLCSPRYTKAGFELYALEKRNVERAKKMVKSEGLEVLWWYSLWIQLKEHSCEIFLNRPWTVWILHTTTIMLSERTYFIGIGFNASKHISLRITIFAVFYHVVTSVCIYSLNCRYVIIFDFILILILSSERCTHLLH